MYTLSLSKSIKRSNYRGISQSQKCIVYVHDVLSSTAYKYAPNLESLLKQQYVCVNVHSDLIIHVFLLVFIAKKRQIRSLSGALHFHSFHNFKNGNKSIRQLHYK